MNKYGVILYRSLAAVGIVIATWLLVMTGFAQVDGLDEGIYAQETDGLVTILSVATDSRWARAGFLPDDQLLAVEGYTDQLLERLHAVKMGQHPGRKYRFTVRRGGATRTLVYTAGYTTAPMLTPTTVATLVELGVKLVFLGTAFYFFFFFDRTRWTGLPSGLLFLLVALLTPFFRLNLLLTTQWLGLTITRVMVIELLWVCFLPGVVLVLCEALPAVRQATWHPGFGLKFVGAILLILYLSYVYVTQDFLVDVSRMSSPWELLRFFSVYRILNGIFMFALVFAAAVGMVRLIKWFPMWEPAFRLTVSNRLFGMLILGLALPFLLGLVLAATGHQFSLLYGIRKLGYLLFPILYVHAIKVFRPPEAGRDLSGLRD